MKKIILAFLMCTISFAHAEVASREELATVFRESLGSQTAEATVRDLGVTGEKADLVRGTIRWLSTNQKFIDRVVSEFIAFGLNDSEELKKLKLTQADVSMFSLNLMSNLLKKGMTRLSDDDVKLFLKREATFARHLPPRACRIYCKEGLSEAFMPYVQAMKKIPWKYYSVSQNREWVNLNKKAIQAELDAYPSVGKIPSSEARFLEQIIANMVFEAVKKLPPEKARGILKTASDLNNATDAETCDFHLFLMNAYISAPGRAGEIARRSLILDIAK